MSYAAIVSPGGGGVAPGQGDGGQPEAGVEAKEIGAEETQHPIDDDLEGFQEVTSKKEKVRDRDKPQNRKKKPRSKKSREVKEGSHEHGDEQQSSKEITPEKDEEEIEYVPAPPPKTNPWKKPVVDKAVTEKSS